MGHFHMIILLTTLLCWPKFHGLMLNSSSFHGSLNERGVHKRSNILTSDHDTNFIIKLSVSSVPRIALAEVDADGPGALSSADAGVNRPFHRNARQSKLLF